MIRVGLGLLCFTVLLLTNSLFAQDFDDTGLVFWLVGDSIEAETGVPLLTLTESAQGLISSSITGPGIELIEEFELNNKRVLDFGVSNTLYNFTLTIPRPLTTVVVHKYQGTGQAFFYDTPIRMLGLLTNSTNGQYGQNVAYTIQNPGDYVISTFQSTTLAGSVYINGVFKNSAPNNRSINGTFRLGASWANDRYFPGQIAEVLVFNSALSDVQRTSVENYLRLKYAPPVSFESQVFILPGCFASVEVPDRYKAYDWKRLNSNGSLTPVGNTSSILVGDTGRYILTATSIFDQISSDTVHVAYPAIFNIGGGSICDGIPLTLDLGFPEGTFDVEWSNPTLIGPQVSIAAPGIYSVEITNELGCSYVIDDIVTFNIEDAAEIQGTSGFCAGNELTLPTLNSDSFTYLWSTGATSATIAPTMDGTYWVEVMNANGCLGRDTVDVNILGTGPQVNFSFVDICAESTAIFIDETTEDNGIIVSRLWSIGSATGVGETFQNSFEDAGSYEVVLEVTLDNGCVGSKIDTIDVFALPIAAFAIPIVCAGELVIFEDASTSIDGEITGWIWSLSNGIVENTQDIEVVFDEEGVESGMLYVETSFGCEAFVEQYFNVLGDGDAICQDFGAEPVFWMYLDEDTETEDGLVSSMINRVTGSSSNPAAIVNRAELVVEPRVNDQATLLLDGVNDYYDFGLNVGLPFTVFYVLKPDKPTINFFMDTQNRMVGSFTPPNSGGYGTSTYNIATPREWFVSSCVNEGDNSIRRYLNGMFISSATNDRPILNTLRIGGAWTNDRYFQGGIAEVLIFNQALDDTQRQSVQDYFSAKYAPPIDLGADQVILPGCPISLSVSDRYTNYQWKLITDQGITNNLGSSNTQEVTDPGTYVLEGVSIFGDFSQDTIEVFPLLVPSNQSICDEAGTVVALNLNVLNFDISWSDPSLIGAAVLISDAGSYSVTITDSENCSFETSFEVVDLEAYTSIALAAPFCLGNELEIGNELNVESSYIWSTGESTPFIEPQESGEYWVEATNANGCVGRDTVQVDIVGVAPTAAFTAGAPCANSPLLLSDATVPEDGVTIGWDWALGPGQEAASGAVVETIPSASGAYPVALTVTLDNGCTGTVRDTLDIQPQPLVGFDYETVIPCAGNPVAFQSASGVPGGGVITNFEWIFGNGTTATGFSGITTFEELGVTTVRHIVTTSAGCKDSLQVDVVVLGSPVVDFSIADVCGGQSVVYQQNVDITASGPVFYNWQFGDGFFSNFPNTSHIYANPGAYSVTLAATGNSFGNPGCVDALTQTVRVYTPPVVSLTANATCASETVTLNDLTNAVVVGGEEDGILVRNYELIIQNSEFRIDVLDGEAEEEVLVGEAGVYTVTLFIETDAGCEAEGSVGLTVLDAPVAAFEVELPVAVPPYVLSPENLSSGAGSFTWLLNGTVISTAFEPEIPVNSAGVLDLQLVASNDLACTDTASQLLTIIVPTYDIGLVDIRYTLTNGLLELRPVISNNGNVAVSQFDLSIDLGLSAGVMQTSFFDLPPSAITEVDLGQTFTYLSARDLPYACIAIDRPNGQVDGDDANNYRCVGLDRSNVTFIPPYPNPATSLVNLGFVVPRAGTVEVEVSTADGKRVGEFSIPLQVGYTLFPYDMSGFPEGIYFFRYNLMGDSKTFKVVRTE